MSEQAAPLGGRGGASFLDDARTTAFGCGVRSGDGAATHALPAAIALTPTPSDCDSAPAAQCNETKCGCNMSGFSVSLDFPASDSRVLDSVFASMRDACNARRPEQTLAFLIAHLQALQRTSAAPLSSPNSNPVSTLAPPQIRPSESAESQSKAQPPEPSAAAAINASSERESQPASASNKSPSGSSSKVSSSSASTSVPKSPASRPLRLERTPSNLPALQHFFGAQQLCHVCITCTLSRLIFKTGMPIRTFLASFCHWRRQASTLAGRCARLPFSSRTRAAAPAARSATSITIRVPSKRGDGSSAISSLVRPSMDRRARAIRCCRRGTATRVCAAFLFKIPAHVPRLATYMLYFNSSLGAAFIHVDLMSYQARCIS